MSNIEWTDTTWNPLAGCSKVSAGCRNCYAEVMGKRLRAMALADGAAGRDPGRKRAYLDAVDERGRWTGKVAMMPEALCEPLGWRKPRRVFVNSMSDLFHPTVPFEFIAAAFGVMSACQQHTFQVLTKQPARAAEFFEWLRSVSQVSWAQSMITRTYAMQAGVGLLVRNHNAWPLLNVWLGTSVEDQTTANERIPLLLQCPAAIRFVSYEPALAAVRFDACQVGDERFVNALTGEEYASVQHCAVRPAPTNKLDWVIVGGESGPGARPFDIAWARSVIAQAKGTDCRVFVKQLGSKPRWALGTLKSNIVMLDKKGGDPSEWPEDLRVREFPEVVA